MKMLTISVAAVLAYLSFGPDDMAAEKALAEKITYEEVEVADGGKIWGQVLWEGDLPELPTFPINKNPEVCEKHADGKQRNSPRLRIDGESRGVRNAVIFLVGITKGKPLGQLETPVLDQVNCAYEPHVLFIAKGERLQMKSSDDILHNIHAVGPSKFNKPFPLPNQIIKQKLRKPGISELSCDAGHSWMSGFVFVVQHPYFAVTDDWGAFELTDVPPGTYKLFAWHEGWKVVKTDKDTDGNVTHYAFDPPKDLSRPVEIEAGGELKLKFLLSEEGIKQAE